MHIKYFAVKRNNKIQFMPVYVYVRFSCVKWMRENNNNTIHTYVQYEYECECILSPSFAFRKLEIFVWMGQCQREDKLNMSCTLPAALSVGVMLTNRFHNLRGIRVTFALTG